MAGKLLGSVSLFLELPSDSFFCSSSSDAKNNTSRNIQARPSKNESRWLAIRARMKNIETPAGYSGTAIVTESQPY
jgi:hypothetical protein